MCQAEPMCPSTGIQRARRGQPEARPQGYATNASPRIAKPNASATSGRIPLENEWTPGFRFAQLVAHPSGTPTNADHLPCPPGPGPSTALTSRGSEGHSKAKTAFAAGHAFRIQRARRCPAIMAARMDQGNRRMPAITL